VPTFIRREQGEDIGFSYQAELRKRDLTQAALKFGLLVKKAEELSGRKLVVKDARYLELLRQIDLANKTQVFAGVLKGDAGKQHSEGGATIGDIANFQFFGTKTIPPRRPEISRARAKDLMSQAALAISKGLPAGRVLDLLSVKIAGEMKAKIRAGIPPSLKSREGTPLIDTGQLWGSITGEARQ
jgi:hypothetical protein